MRGSFFGTPLLGNTTLDNDHKELALSLHKLGVCTSVSGVLRVMDEVILRWAQHGGKEELRMECHAYPGLEEHRKDHIDVLNKFYAFAILIKSKSDAQVRALIPGYAKELAEGTLHQHIRNYDEAFVAFVETKERK